MPAANAVATNRNKDKKRVSFSLRCHRGLLKDYAAQARKNGRSKNAEMVLALENGLVHKVG